MTSIIIIFLLKIKITKHINFSRFDSYELEKKILLNLKNKKVIMFTVFQIFVVSIAFLLTAQSIIGSIYNLDFFLMSPFF